MMGLQHEKTSQQIYNSRWIYVFAMHLHFFVRLAMSFANRQFLKLTVLLFIHMRMRYKSYDSFKKNLEQQMFLDRGCVAIYFSYFKTEEQRKRSSENRYSYSLNESMIHMFTLGSYMEDLRMNKNKYINNARIANVYLFYLLKGNVHSGRHKSSCGFRCQIQLY